MEDAKNVENDRYAFSEHISDEAKHYLATRYGYKEYLPKPATAAALPIAEAAHLLVGGGGGLAMAKRFNIRMAGGRGPGVLTGSHITATTGPTAGGGAQGPPRQCA